LFNNSPEQHLLNFLSICVWHQEANSSNQQPTNHQHPDKLNEKIPVNKQYGLKSFFRQELWSTVTFKLMIKFNRKKEMLVTLI